MMTKVAPTTNIISSSYSSLYSNENPVLTKPSINHTNQPLFTQNQMIGQQSNSFNSAAAAAFASLYGMLPSNFMFPDGQTSLSNNYNNSFSSSSPRPFNENSNQNISTKESSLDTNKLGKNGLSTFSTFPAPSNLNEMNFIQKLGII
jgi:hypothetical protein